VLELLLVQGSFSLQLLAFQDFTRDGKCTKSFLSRRLLIVLTVFDTELGLMLLLVDTVLRVIREDAVLSLKF